MLAFDNNRSPSPNIHTRNQPQWVASHNVESQCSLLLAMRVRLPYLAG
jgi:hypothetical protein